MKVAFLCITLGREGKGGELYVHQLANGLVGRGHTVTVVQAGSLLEDREYEAVRVPVPFRLHRIDVGPLSLSRAAITERVVRAANRTAHHLFATSAAAVIALRRPDVLVPLIMAPELGYARLLRRSLGCRLVSVGHGTAGNDALALGAVDAFVATSPRQAVWARYFSSARVELIPVGVDVDRFRPDGAGADLSLPRPVLLQVGSILAVKRVPLSVAAVAALGRGSLLVVGDGPDAVELDAIAIAQLGTDRYRRIPRVSHASLAGYYRAADALLFPSGSGETAGLVTLEALACGCAVVATDDETRRWMVGEVATLVDPQDSAAFARGIERALATKDPGRFRRHAEAFSWPVIAERHEAVYAAVLGDRPATRDA